MTNTISQLISTNIASWWNEYSFTKQEQLNFYPSSNSGWVLRVIGITMNWNDTDYYLWCCACFADLPLDISHRWQVTRPPRLGVPCRIGWVATGRRTTSCVTMLSPTLLTVQSTKLELSLPNVLQAAIQHYLDCAQYQKLSNLFQINLMQQNKAIQWYEMSLKTIVWT